MKHEVGSDCPLCEEKLKTAHPDLAQWFRERVKPAFPLVHVSWAWRGKEDQDRFVAQKRSKLHFPLSPHNKCDDEGNPCSLAIDLFEIINGRGTWPVTVFHQIQDMVERFGDPIAWGGRWKSLGDFDHFELNPKLLVSGKHPGQDD